MRGAFTKFQVLIRDLFTRRLVISNSAFIAITKWRQGSTRFVTFVCILENGSQVVDAVRRVLCMSTNTVLLQME